MEKQILILISLAMLWSAPSQAGWWDNNNQQQQQQIDKLNGELTQQQQKNDGMGIVILVLGVGVVVALVVGSAVGSKARRDNEQ